jgi:hypothetical protein
MATRERIQELKNNKVYHHLEGNDAVKSKKEHEMAHAKHYDISGGKRPYCIHGHNNNNYPIKTNQRLLERSRGGNNDPTFIEYS